MHTLSVQIVERYGESSMLAFVFREVIVVWLSLVGVQERARVRVYMDRVEDYGEGQEIRLRFEVFSP